MSAEKAHELLAGVSPSGLALHLAGLGVQSGVERECAVALVFEAVPFRPAGRERRHTVAAIQGLNGGLFVNAEYGGVPGRVEIEPDDVGRLALEVRVVGGHVAFQTMRLQAGFPPNAMNHRLA